MSAVSAPDVQPVALHEATRHRYLNYALSVITARALPDVRDGLKPVQRRILYAMFHNLGLRPEARYRKSAAVVGEVMAKYHPHGDSSIYEAMVRMAQPFSLRHPLVDGQGNFGSMDGDGAAAMRYTECKLRPLAVELLSEIKQRTVDYRPNYDGQHFEPVVLPAQFPQLLVNGTEGIAVGMATRIPPHNLVEIIDACIELIDDPQLGSAELCKHVRGPDFPTGGIILNEPGELQQLYETGSGPVRVQSRWHTEKASRRTLVVITEIPYAVNKATLVEKIGGLVADRKVPQILDVRDESTDVVRIVLEVRKAHDAAPAMAYLFKHTALQTNYHVNLTCLVPGNAQVPEPKRCNLREILRHWLDFRFETVRRRFVYELEKLRERIHILEALAIIFDELDEAIRIIRASEGKRDAAEQLMVRFGLDDVQADAILELRLYKLAKLEILSILEELEEKQAEADRIASILASDEELWSVVRTELLEIRKLYGEERRTVIGGDEAPSLDFDASAYIVSERAYVIVTRNGWIKRQASFTEVEKIRIREGDAIGWIARANTRRTITFFSSLGGAYVLRVDDVPATTGYGDPVQKHFAFSDGERIVGVAVHDPQGLPAIDDEQRRQANLREEPPPPYGVAVTRKGRILRFALAQHNDVSNKSGRRYAKPQGAGDAVVAVYVAAGSEEVSIASEQGRALTFPVLQANCLKGAGKGVTGMKLRPGDFVLAFELTTHRLQGATVTTNQGREEVVRPNKYRGSRAGRGKVVLKRDRFVSWAQPILRLDQLHAESDDDDDDQAGLPLDGSK